jgi:hypothetical protein
VILDKPLSSADKTKDPPDTSAKVSPSREPISSHSQFNSKRKECKLVSFDN